MNDVTNSADESVFSGSTNVVDKEELKEVKQALKG